MLDDKKKQRLKKVGLVLVYALAVIYLVVLFDSVTSIESDISSMQTDIDEIKSNVDSIQDEVKSIQNDVSSIESNTRR